MERHEQYAYCLWWWQYQHGITEDAPDKERIDEWIGSRTYAESVLVAALDGDLEALELVRAEAGLPPLS